MSRFLAIASLAAAVVASTVASGCAAVDETTADDGTLGEDGEVADQSAESGADALSNATIAGYAAVSPPQGRVATSDVKPIAGASIASGHALQIIRTMTYQGAPAKLVVDVSTYATSLVATADLLAKSRGASADDHVAASPYAKSLAALAHGETIASMKGASPALDEAEPFALTVDMCQSHKPWEKRLFDWAVALADQRHEPTPIGISMTGLWAKAYPKELQQLVDWEAAGKLSITWINHSSTHPLHCLDSACRNAEFLTNASVDMNEEVMGLERTLLARGIVPSTMFRFPGLVHDAARLAQLNALSLMPLDADGWIAKGQPIHPRSVVLVHGNGNEAAGITGFLAQANKPARAAALKSGDTRVVSTLLAAPLPPAE